jgi:hypothetical protein
MKIGIIKITSSNSDFKLGFESPIQDTVQAEPIYDVKRITE